MKNFFKTIFSISNSSSHRIINILGIKIKFKVKIYGINLGAGNWEKSGWAVVDWYAKPKYIDYKINLLENQYLPIKQKSMKYVFCSHLIEHLTDENNKILFKEVYRILKKGGCFRLACPDADKAFIAYKNKDKDFFFLNNEVYLVGDSIERRLVNFFASFKCKNYDNQEIYSGGPIIDINEICNKIKNLNEMEFIEYCKTLIPQNAYYVAHINGFNYKKLEKMLQEAGFSKVQISSFQGSSVKEMREEIFDNRPNHSLFVEAIK